MKFLVFADLQADRGSETLFGNPTESLRLSCVTKLYSDLRTLYRQHKCDALVDLGDTFDDRNSIDVPTLRTVLTGLAWLPENELNTRVIGNHDQFLRDNEIHNGPVLAHKFHNVISDREIIAVDGAKLFFCAYPKDHAELAVWLKNESSKVRCRKILFGHFQVRGAYLNSVQTTTGIPQEALNGFDLVVLGHIHQPQQVNERIYYVGSPFQQDWGEAGQKKRVLIVDTEDATAISVPLEGYPEYQLVSLPEFKKASQAATENRYRVVLKNHAETEEFFTHPAFNRAAAQYAYDVGETEKGEAAPEKDWTFDGILRRYLTQVPPSGVGIEFNVEEMLAAGKSIVENG